MVQLNENLLQLGIAHSCSSMCHSFDLPTPPLSSKQAHRRCANRCCAKSSLEGCRVTWVGHGITVGCTPNDMEWGDNCNLAGVFDWAMMIGIPLGMLIFMAAGAEGDRRTLGVP